MVTKNNIFEDLARVSTGVAATLFESAKTVQDGLKSRAQGVAKSADLVTRDEFEVFRSMVMRIRTENETLIKDAAELKKQLQFMSSTIDSLKEQVAKSGSADGKKIMDEMKKAAELLDQKLSGFESALEQQDKKIEAVSAKKAEHKAEKKTEEKSEAKQSKKVVSIAEKIEEKNINLFGETN